MDSGWTRRALLSAGGAAAVGGLAGCVANSPEPHVKLTVSVREGFEGTTPTAVPLSVGIQVQNVGDERVAVRGVEVVATDADRQPLGSRRLGAFARSEADPSNRASEEGEGVFAGTVYTAEWTREPVLETEGVPEWLSFRVGTVRFGGEGDEQSALLPVGRARATQPVPPLIVSAARRREDFPPVGTMSSEDYERVYIDVGDPSETDSVLFESPPTATEEPTTG